MADYFKRWGSASDRLYSLALTNSTYYIVGDSDIGLKDVFGLTSKRGNLFGYTSDRQQISINTATGKGTLLRDLTDTNSTIWGATYQADPKPTPTPGKSVPEPSTILGWLGVTAIGASRLKKKSSFLVCCVDKSTPPGSLPGGFLLTIAGAKFIVGLGHSMNLIKATCKSSKGTVYGIYPSSSPRSINHRLFNRERRE